MVGAYIQPTLNTIFFHLDQAAENWLQTQTLQDCIDQMRYQINQEKERRNKL